MLGGRRSQRQRRRPSIVRDSGGGPGVHTRRHRPDYWLLIVCALLLSVGLVVVYSISPGLAVIRGVSDNYYISKQLVAVGLGVLTFLIATSIKTEWWRKSIIPLALLAVVGCIVVLLTPVSEVYRAHRWVIIGGFSFQVAELIKFSILIGVASFLTVQWQKGLLSNKRATLKPLAILIILSGIVIAKLQSDLGSTMVVVAMIGAMAFIVGIPLRTVAIILGVVAIGMIIVVGGSSYRRDRFTTFLHPQSDCQSTGYQACQALIAVGSGGLFGLGLGHSVQAYGYLPEASNDSIFAIIAEKFGFVGVSLIIGFYTLLIARLKRIAERTPDQFSRLLVVGVLAWISTQTIINIGAMIGLLPLKGITLPFISYGGTSMIFLTAALGLVFRISRYTSYSQYEPQDNNQTAGDSNDRRRVGRAHNPNLVSRPRG